MTEAQVTPSTPISSLADPEAILAAEREEKFRRVLEASPDGFSLLHCVRDPSGAIVDFVIEYANPVAAYHINRTPEELVGQGFLQIFPDCRTNGIFDRYRVVVQTGISTTFETFYDASNVRGWFRNVVVKLDDGIAISFSDITDRKQAELALQQQEQHFRIALQTAKLGSWEHDLITGSLTCSAQCKANFGLPPEAEFNHETLFAALHPDDRPLVQTMLQRAIAEQTDYEVEERCYHPDGSLHWLTVRGQLVYDSQGQPLRMVGVTLDITERKQYEESLQRSNQRLSKVLESITDAFVAFDRNWRYTYVNQEAARLLGRSVQELLGQCWQEVFPEVAYQPSVIVQQFERAMVEQSTIRFEAFSHTTHSWLDVSLFPSPDGLAMYFRDISERKRAEQRRDIQSAIAQTLAEATTITEAAPAILQALCENLDWQVGVLWGVDTHQSTLRYINCWQTPHLDIEEFISTNGETCFAPGTGLPGRVWVDRQPLWVSRLAQDNNFLRAALANRVGLQSAFGFPIHLGDTVLGVMECFSQRVQAPDPDLLQMMAAIGSQIGQFMERKRAETALQQREAELRLITNAVPVLIAFIDAEQRYRFSNQKYEEWFGRPEQEIQGQYLWEFLGPATYETIRPYVEQVLAGEEVSFERKIAFQAGSTRDVLINYVPRCNSQGQVEGFVALVSDITARKQSEEILRQSEERLRIAQQAANAGVWDWDISQNQVTWSEEYYRLYGLDAATTLPSYENWLNSVVEQDRERVDRAATKALQHQIDLNVEFRILHPMRGERWLTAIGQTLLDQNHQPQRMTGIALDITQRKQAEKALQRYQLLSEYSRDIVLYLSQTGQILEANQAAVQTYGYSRSELLSLTIADLRSPETLALLSQQMAQASQSGILFETLHQRKDGSQFPVEVSSQSAMIDGESVVLSIIRDITERKQADLERENLLGREQRARKTAEAAEQRAQFLAEASKILTSSLDFECTLKSVAQAIVPTLADWCAVDILKQDGTLERLATTHIDPEKVRWGLELHHRYPPDLNAPYGLAHVLRTGQSEYYPTITDEQLVAAARDPEHLKILREIGFSSAMLVPLHTRGQTLGAISLIAAESGHSYSLEDLFLAEELAHRAAIALDHAHLYWKAQKARQAAESAADRTARLQTVTAALSESLTAEQVAEVIVGQSMATLEAAAALVVLVSDDRTELEIIKSLGYETDLVESWRRFSINTDVPLAQAIRTGEPVWVETLLERIARYPHLSEIYNRYNFKSWIAIPLVVEGQSVGGMLLSFNELKQLTSDDREFMLALSRQCAQAIFRAKLYEAERLARAEAEQANRIKDEFLAVLSHELRSPLNPILGWSRLLQTRSFDQQGTQKALETIERNARLQTQLIDDLLDVSRILQGKMVLDVCAINLVPVIEAALETVRLSAEAKGIEIKKTIANPPGLISGDAGRLQQIVWNLLSNAVKFTPRGGRVEINLSLVRDDLPCVPEPEPEVSPRQADYAQITVKDTGKGITPEFLPHVFDYFRQEDGTITRKFGGLGLGLAIVRYLTELHGGTVRAESPGEGQGATFTVRLPLQAQEKSIEQETGSHPRPLTPLTAHPLMGLRILGVDDEMDMRDLLFTILQQAGVTVLVVASAMEALEALNSFKPDILISDIGMPQVDGYQLIRQIRRFPPHRGGQIPAIALTAYAGAGNQQKALAAGFHCHLAKPIEPEELLQAIVALVQTN